jgi:hypothetical protein
LFSLIAAKLKRPPTPYSLFMRDIGDKIRQESTDSSDRKGNFMEHVSALWRELPGDEKQKYVEIAEKAQKDYMKSRSKLLG